MFDLEAQDGSVRTRRYNSPIPNDPVPEPKKAAELDTEEMVQMHHRLLDFYTRELDRQAPNRRLIARDHDFYDNEQWDPDDAALLEERGQKPIVYNVVSATIDWILGTEERTRTDFKVLPRRKEEGKAAERKSQLLKYLSDVNQTAFNQSRAFEDAVKGGIGWLEDGYQDDTEGEPIFNDYESWRNILWDSTAKRLDLEDGRYMFRTKFVDEDVLAANFEDRLDIIRRSVDATDDFIDLDIYGDEPMDSSERFQEGSGEQSESRTSDRVSGYQRRRVRAIEAWIKLPVKSYVMRGDQYRGELFDPFSRGHVDAIYNGEAEAVKKPVMRVYCALFTSVGMIYFGPSPYRHNRYPFTPVWGYRRDRDGMPYGVMRRLVDIQEDVNKRASKALWILSSNKIIYEKGAFDDPDEAREELARPDAFQEKNAGKEVDTDVDRELSQYQLQLMQSSIAMIQQAGGVTDENLGRKTNAVSGVAIEARQDQGSLATLKIFSRYRLSKQVEGEKQLSLVEQFMKEPKQFRITGTRGKPQYLAINDGLPENDIVRSKADYIISEADWQASLRRANVNALLEVMSKLPPQIALVLLDLVVESMDVPNREELVKRIRAITGQRDPDAEEPTPEELAREEQAAADAQMQRDGVRAEIAKNLAAADKATADAAKARAEAERIARAAVGDDIDAVNNALAAAQQTLALPAAAPVADAILEQTGFVSQADRMIAAARNAAVNVPAPVPQGAGQPPAPGLAP
jgi:hypothetical protein